MSSSLQNQSVALLVCSGFEEQPFVKIQQALVAAGANVKVISRDSGLTNGWAGSNWGLSYPVDGQLSETLAIDFDIMVIPDGTRHTEMLFNDAHGMRLINAFIRENVPSLVFGSGVDALKAHELLGEDINLDNGPVLNKTLVMSPVDADNSEVIALLQEAIDNSKNIDAAA